MVKLIDDEALEKLLTIVDAHHLIIDKDRKGDKIMEWIPCTKRLPEKNGRYLVTRGLNVCGSLWGKVDILNYNDVIAWMPLPVPYKGGEQDG